MATVKTRVFAIVGFAFSGLALAFLVASFSSPYWVASRQTVAPSGFENMGLWEICFHNKSRVSTTEKDAMCTSYKMEANLTKYYYPTVIVVVQALTTSSLLMSMLSLLTSFVAVAMFSLLYITPQCCRAATLGIQKLPVLASAILSCVSALLLVAIAIMIFGIKVDYDLEWLPQPVRLSWGFVLASLACVFHFFSGICMATDFYRLRHYQPVLVPAPLPLTPGPVVPPRPPVRPPRPLEPKLEPLLGLATFVY